MFKTLSLFCGCGGMDLGLLGDFTYLGNYYAANPFCIVTALDNDPYAVTLYNHNFSNQAQVQDVRDLNIKELPAHDLLLGGFPCQSFSISAQNPPRLGYKDEKGKLFFAMVKVLQSKQPRFFIAENVKGLLSANKKQAFPMILEEFAKAGYFIKYQVLNAAAYGIPQKRERIFIVGFREEKDYQRFSFPQPTTAEQPVALQLALDPQAEHEEKWYFSEKAVAGMLRVKEKMNKGRVQDPLKPCNTISAHLAKVSLNSTDPVLMVNGRYRRFSPREAATIQSFPLSFNLDSVSDVRKYRAIGNAVPPVLMWHLIQELQKIL